MAEWFLVTGRAGKGDRPALPAGHPVTWGAITDGTVLDGAAYPHPVFLTVAAPAQQDDEAA